MTKQMTQRFLCKRLQESPTYSSILEFATNAHKGQKRKYTGEDYINHPIWVSNILYFVDSSVNTICAGLLHDVIEDCNVTKEEIAYKFGTGIAQLVWEVTDQSKPEDGNRATRKEIDRQHLAKASPEGKTIKLADIIDNTQDIVKYGKGFAPVYVKEAEALMEVLKEGNKHLYAVATEMLKDARRQLDE